MIADVIGWLSDNVAARAKRSMFLPSAADNSWSIDFDINIPGDLIFDSLTILKTRTPTLSIETPDLRWYIVLNEELVQPNMISLITLKYKN
jgi:hypothetical protein